MTVHDMHLEISTIINASAQDVYGLVSDLGRMENGARKISAANGHTEPQEKSVHVFWELTALRPSSGQFQLR